MSQEAVVIYHHPCLDGAAAGWIVGDWLKKKGYLVTYHQTNYGKAAPIELCAGKEVYIVDFSYPLEELKSLANVAANFVILDHHETAEPILDELRTWLDSLALYDYYVKFNNNLSGTGLAWEFCRGKSTPIHPIFAAIQDRDLWTWNLPHTEEITEFLRSFPPGHELFNDLIYKTTHKLSEILSAGSALIRAKENQIAGLLAEGPAHYLSFDNYKNIPCYNCPGFLASDLGNAVVDTQTDPNQFVILFHFNPHGIKYSFRSKDSAVDVGAFAKQFGGGGHRNAAGLNVDWGKQNPLLQYLSYLPTSYES